MAFSFAFAARLGPAYQPDVFGRDIPPFLTQAENVSRIGAIFLSAFMVVEFSGARQRLGLAIYALGLAVYFASYWAQIAYPDSAWSRSLAGFAAPAYTTLPWVIGIALIGERWVLPYPNILSLCFVLCALVFVVSHTSHAALVHARAY